MDYLTPEDFATAEKNGISEERAKARFYKMGWSKQRAITQKLKKPQHDWNKYHHQSLVTAQTFYQRIKKGMTPEEAALTPPLPKGCRFGKTIKITQEHMEQAVKNGIKVSTLYARVYNYDWDVERAVTEPIHEHCRRKLDKTIELVTN